MRAFSRRLFAFLAIAGPVLQSCSDGGGASGTIPREDVFLEVQGCLGETVAEEVNEPSVFSARVPVDVSLLEVRLEVLRGEVDLVVGTENPPADYFNVTQGAAVQRILVGPLSNEPLLARTWYVALNSPFQIEESCPPESGPDWQLAVQRSGRVEGLVLLEHEGSVPECTENPCSSRELSAIVVPEEAVALEVILETIQGDADLFVGKDLGTAEPTELYSSMNPGPGFDVVSLGADVSVQLRGESLDLSVESWGSPSEYRLQASYNPALIADDAQRAP